MIPTWRSLSLQHVTCIQCGAEVTISGLVRQAVYCVSCRESRRKKSQTAANHKLKTSLKAQSAVAEPLAEASDAMNAIEIADASTLEQLGVERTEFTTSITVSQLPQELPQAQKPQGAAPVKLPRRLLAHRCSCGLCRSCREDQRWNQIFQEKFADPDYYSVRPVRQGSSLGWLG